jgi:hypothetical protein
MGLFNRKKSRKVIDRVYISMQAKLKGLAALAKENAQVIFVSWFNESQREAEDFFKQQNIPAGFYQAREIQHHLLNGKQVYFTEHYPLRSKEEELFEKLQLDEVIIYSSLTEPIFNKFGGDQIIKLMQKLGMGENEAVEHKMISRSIAKAQQKLEKNMLVEQPANGAADWFLRNHS